MTQHRRRAAGAVLAAAAVVITPALAPAALPSSAGAAGQSWFGVGVGTAHAQEALPPEVDARNHFRTEWGEVGGKKAYVYTPKLVEAGKPIRVVGTGLTNLAGTAGARIGITFPAKTVHRSTQLPDSALGGLNAAQKKFVWAVVTAGADGHFALDMDFPTEANAADLARDPFTPGSVHVLSVNVGSISGKDAAGKLIDPSGATETPPFKVIAAGTLESELAAFDFTPTGAPDVFDGGGPSALQPIDGATAADRGGAPATSVGVTVPSLAANSWVHVTPVAADGSVGASSLQGQWRRTDAAGTAVFDTGALASGTYTLVVHRALADGTITPLGTTAWTHTGGATPSTSTARPTELPKGPWFVGPPHTPWWTTSAVAPTSGRTISTVRSTRTSTAAAAGGSATTAAAVAGGANVASPGGGTAGGVAALPSSVPLAGRVASASGTTGGGTAVGGTAVGGTAVGGTAVGSGAAVSGARAGQGLTGMVSSVADALDPRVDEDPALLASDGEQGSSRDRDVVLVVAAAVLLFLAALFASGLVVASHLLTALRRRDPR